MTKRKTPSRILSDLALCLACPALGLEPRGGQQQTEVDLMSSTTSAQVSQRFADYGATIIREFWFERLASNLESDCITTLADLAADKTWVAWVVEAPSPGRVQADEDTEESGNRPQRKGAH